MKKLNKFFAVLVALAMMATLCVSMAFAEEGDEPTTPTEPTTTAQVPTGTATTAKLVKYLQAGTGVDLPAATYNFKFSPNDNNPANGPTEFTTTIEIAATDIDANGDYVKAKSIADIFSGKNFTKAGEYIFNVTEEAPTYTEVDNQELTTNNNSSSYELHLYVVNDGTSTKIDEVSVKEEDGKKVDPTIVKPTADEGTVDGEDQGFAFTNTFKKNLVVDPNDDTKGALNVKKVVDGKYADKDYDWSFSVAYTLPAANQGEVKYKVIDATGAVKVAEKVATSPISETLKDGWQIVVTKMPQGTKWTATEDTSEATVQNAEKYVSTITGTQKSLTGKGTLSSDEATLTATGTGLEVKNTLKDSDVSPTGILISNLPYIALALVAIGGLVAYVVVRRRDEDNA